MHKRMDNFTHQGFFLSINAIVIGKYRAKLEFSGNFTLKSNIHRIINFCPIIPLLAFTYYDSIYEFIQFKISQKCFERGITQIFRPEGKYLHYFPQNR